MSASSPLEWFTTDLERLRLAKARMISIRGTLEKLAPEHLVYLSDFCELVDAAFDAVTKAIRACEGVHTHDASVLAHQALERAWRAVGRVDDLEGDVALRVALLNLAATTGAR